MKKIDVEIYEIDKPENEWTNLYVAYDPVDEDGDCFCLSNSLHSDCCTYFTWHHLNDLIETLQELRAKYPPKAKEPDEDGVMPIIGRTLATKDDIEAMLERVLAQSLNKNNNK